MEIDLLIDDGGLINAYEVKAGRTANTESFKNLNYWSKLSGRSQDGNTVIYAGDLNQIYFKWPASGVEGACDQD